MFVELLARSCFSFLRGASHPEEMIRTAGALKLSGIALTDVNGIYGCVRAWSAVKELTQAGAQEPAHSDGGEVLQYIVGAELTLTCGSDGSSALKRPEPLTVVVLVENLRGYESLCRILSLGHQDQPKGQCAITKEHLLAHPEGLSILFVAPQDPNVLAFRWEKPAFPALSLKTLGEALARAFPGRLGVITYRHLDGRDRSRQKWAHSLAAKLSLPIVASARPSYHHGDRKPLSDVLCCIREGMTLDQAGTRLSPNQEQVLRSEADMRRLFSDHPEWVDASVEFARRCTFDFSQIRYHFPCSLEPGQSADERLAELTWEGVGRRFPEGISPELRAQLKRELALIKKIEVAPYFLSTRDVVEMARRRKILCQGRGSAANSAVCFVLGITAVDPTRSKLLFERFLSEERAEPPDIDIDFEHERREEVIQEIYATYGREQAAMVSEIISYRGKSALREVGKVFGLSLEQVERLSSTVSWTRLEEAHEARLVESGFDLDDPRLGLVLAIAAQLQGFPRHLSIHVGGFVLSSRPLFEVAPIEPARMEGRTVIPWDKDDIEALGFFKVDVLALGMLTAIRKCLEFVVDTGGLPPPQLNSGTASLAHDAAHHHGEADRLNDAADRLEHFDPLQVITRIPKEDAATYNMLCRADTVGVFQVESRAQMSMLPRLRPRSFYDLVVEVALVRPGPIQGGMVHPYLRRRNGEEEAKSPHLSLEPILARTLGVPLFQEQVMQIAITGAGYSGGQADQLRRDMAAWKKHGRLMRHKERLLLGFTRRGISRQFAEALFEQIKGFGDYGFPESHASSFALLVYASSYLKCHYPAHFTAALLNSQPMGFYSAQSLVRDAQKHGVWVHDVSVHHSTWDARLEAADETCRIKSQAPGAKRSIRLGLRQLKGLSETAGLRIVEARNFCAFSSVEELRRRAALSRSDMKLLAASGALGDIEECRRNALWQAEAPRTNGLFAQLDAGEAKVTLPELRSVEQLVLDYEQKGLSLHDHPLRYYRKRLMGRGAVRAADLAYLPQGSFVSLGGLVTGRQRPQTASGVVFITLEDESGNANLVLYSSIFERYDHVARHAQLLFIEGQLERSDFVNPKSTSPLVPPITAPSDEAPSDEAPSSEAPTVVLHVIVKHLERLSSTSAGALNSRSRDFH